MVLLSEATNFSAPLKVFVPYSSELSADIFFILLTHSWQLISYLKMHLLPLIQTPHSTKSPISFLCHEKESKIPP